MTQVQLLEQAEAGERHELAQLVVLGAQLLQRAQRHEGQHRADARAAHVEVCERWQLVEAQPREALGAQSRVRVEPQRRELREPGEAAQDRRATRRRAWPAGPATCAEPVVVQQHRLQLDAPTEAVDAHELVRVEA